MVNIHSEIMEVIYGIYCPMELGHAQKSINLNLLKSMEGSNDNAPCVIH